MTFESSLARLDQILAQLSDGDIALEQSLALYAEGAALIESCTKQLSEAKLEIERLSLKNEVAEDEL